MVLTRMENKDKETKKENKEIRTQNKTFLYEYDKMSGRG